MKFSLHTRRKRRAINNWQRPDTLFLPAAGSGSDARAGLGRQRPNPNGSHTAESFLQLTAQMPPDKCSLGSKRQNPTPGALLNFTPLLQSKKKTAVPNDMEIKSSPTYIVWAKQYIFT